jgi:hypothetical protein
MRHVRWNIPAGSLLLLFSVLFNDHCALPGDHLQGLKWAQPSVQHLRQLMHRVYTHREEAAAKGAAARARMLERYSPDAIADMLVKELKRIEAIVP